MYGTVRKDNDKFHIFLAFIYCKYRVCLLTRFLAAISCLFDDFLLSAFCVPRFKEPFTINRIIIRSLFHISTKCDV